MSIGVLMLLIASFVAGAGGGSAAPARHDMPAFMHVVGGGGPVGRHGRSPGTSD